MLRLSFTCFFLLFALNPESVFSAEKAEQKVSNEGRYKNLELFQKVLHFIENNYVDPVSNDVLIEGAIRGMLDSLDPHSNFLSKEIFRDMKVDTSGEFGGIGIEIGIKDGVLTVVSPIEDTPAWKAGIKPDDRIVKINGVSTKGLTLVEAVAKMRGLNGSKVNLGIYRKGFKQAKDVVVARETIRIKAVRYDVVEKGYGYIRIKTFNENTGKDVELALKDLKQKGNLKGLVIDMRRTPGGLLDQAVEVVGWFVDGGVVVSTVGRDKNQKEVKHARRGKAYKNFPIAVLVDSSTASAAEIVAGALQDHKRAVVVGQQTFGKGSVQTVIDLGRDMGLKLTIARYFTPNGRNIQEKGVTPDIVLESYDPDLLERAKISKESLREKDLPGHLAGSGDFSEEELKAMVKAEGSAQKAESEKPESEEMAPFRVDPKTDYQVVASIKYLKSFDVFKSLNLPEGEAEASDSSVEKKTE